MSEMTLIQGRGWVTHNKRSRATKELCHAFCLRKSHAKILWRLTRGVIRQIRHSAIFMGFRRICMSKRRGSILGKLGWGLAGDVLLFCTALLFMSIFAFTSFSNAYLIALLLLAVVLIAFVVYRRTRKKVDS